MGTNSDCWCHEENSSMMRLWLQLNKMVIMSTHNSLGCLKRVKDEELDIISVIILKKGLLNRWASLSRDTAITESVLSMKMLNGCIMECPLVKIVQILMVLWGVSPIICCGESAQRKWGLILFLKISQSTSGSSKRSSAFWIKDVNPWRVG